MRRRILAALVLATGLAFHGIARAQQEPPAAPADGAPCAAGGQERARANGKSLQPTAEVAQEAQTGCGTGGQGPDAAAADRAGKDVDEMYDRLMRESADDLKGRPEAK